MKIVEVQSLGKVVIFYLFYQYFKYKGYLHIRSASAKKYNSYFNK